MSPEEKMIELYLKCCAELGAFEIWEGYYKMRFEELKTMRTLFPKSHFSDVLEIGCGIGYQSALLSCLSDHVTASDIDLGNMAKHSRGLEITRKFIESAGVSNVRVVNADAQNLPFADNTFDFIYSSYAFQYVPDKSKALTEIKRVLKPGGNFFCVLPSTGNKIITASLYYKALFKKAGGLFARRNNRSGNAKAVQESFQSALPKPWLKKLLPPPDDEANNFLNELFTYTPAKWRKLFIENGHQIVLDRNTSNITNGARIGYGRSLRQQLRSNGFIIVTKK